jgi:tetratricopeptide (TPR) repeat protein
MKATHRRTSDRSRSRIRGVVALASLIVASCVSIRLPGLSKEDQIFSDFLIREVRYYDTALRFLESLEKRGGLDPKDAADISWAKIDLYKAQGRDEEAAKLEAETRKKFPSHPRSTGGDLEKIRPLMPKVVTLFSAAAVQPDAAKAAAFRAQAKKMYEEEISKPLDALIAELQKRLDDAKKSKNKAGGAEQRKKQGPKRDEPPEVANLLLSLEYAELVRVQFCLTYARQLAEDAPERKALLEKGAKLAETFVNDRFDFPTMLYNAQLHRGLYAFELGQFSEAEEFLSVLYDVEPPVQRPFSKDLVDEFKGLRLQAILFGARARNTARNCPKAVQLIEQHYLKPRKDEFDLTKAEDDPVVRTTAVLVRLEYGIALAGSGQPQKGLREIQEKVIEKPGMPAPLLTDARKALGRLAVMGGVRLGARDYYQAAIGLKSELRWEDALETFKEALSKLNPRNMKETSEIAPLCLNEIGEIHFQLKNYIEAALAYQEVCRSFPGAEPALLSKVATNFLASSNRAVKTIQGGTSHSGLLQLKDEATKASEKSSGGFASLEVIMSDAKGLEKEGRYKDAWKKYLEVPREYKGVKVPFYWRAQANAWTCLYREWELADDAGRKKLEDEIQKVIAALEKIVPSAIQDSDKTGAAVAALTLGQARFYRGEYDKASEALKHFTTDLSGEETYRCYGAGTLVLAESKMGAVDEAEKHFKENLSGLKECAASAIVAAAASGLADGYEAAGKPKKAAEYALLAAKHPTSKEDMEKPQNIADLVRRLIDGGMMKEAEPYLEKLKGMKTNDDCLERQIASLEARVYVAAKEWNKVIAKLEKYVEDYKPQVEDKCYEDALVLKDLAQAYLSREARASLKDLKAAERCYDMAGALMQRRAQRDKSLEKTFWQWALELMKIKMRIGDAGERNSYRAVTEFVAKVKGQEGDWGGLKEQFLRLEKDASDRYAKALAPKN